MRLADENQLIILLRELIYAQDNVTHTNEKGAEFAENTRIFIRERERIYESILNFVRYLVIPNNLKVLVYGLDSWSDGIIDVRLECVQQRNGSDLWAIREKGFCLNKEGEWELEPIPSSRTDIFFKRCRWKTAEEALKFWQQDHESRFEHYRRNANNSKEIDR